MTSKRSLFAGTADQEIAALIETLHSTGLRLEELTGGEVDAVIGRDGAAFLLQRAQEKLRLNEATRQASILNALPVNIALIDGKGVIVSVNRTWDAFAEANGGMGPGHGIGVDYLKVCENAMQAGSVEGGLAADGIRSVLTGDANSFSMEYPCHSQTQQRWFLMTVTPLHDNGGLGAVLRHLNITGEHKAKDDLLASELQFRQMAESVGDVFTLREFPSGDVIYVNPAYEVIFGRSCASLYADSDSWVDAVHPDDVALLHVRDSQEAALPLVQMEFRIVRPDGDIRWIEARAYPVRDSAGSIIRIASIIKDITERKQSELGMKRLHRVYSVLSEISALTVRARDREELFRAVCQIAVEQGGFHIAILGILDRDANKLTLVASAGKCEAVLAAIRNTLSSDVAASKTLLMEAIHDQKTMVSNDSEGDPRLALRETFTDAGVRSLAVLPLIVARESVGVLVLYAKEKDFFHEEEMKLLNGLAADVALAINHIERQEQLHHLSCFDQLTGLANRKLFIERLVASTGRAADSGHRVAVFLIDIERFKNFNDSLGQAAGDALLQQVAQWLTQHVGEVKHVARIGADQFAVALPDEGRTGASLRQLETMSDALLNHSFHLSGGEYRIAAKFGAAMFPDDGANADILLKNAEAALKKAKAGGHRHLFYTLQMTETVAHRLTLENQLRQALDKDEFVLHYQPKVNLASGKITGVEALIRWNDPRTGLVAPNMFIPILEETGMIYNVGRWALRKSLEDYLRWRATGLLAVRVAVNVSPQQLRHPGFISEIEQIAASHAHAAEALELEITEGMIMDDMSQALSSLQTIRALGMHVAIDDFGTGFSSLGYLSKLPIDILKIDRMFVTGMATDPQGLSLVSTIITLAHSLNLKVVAEGVETEGQAQLLRLLSCDEMQGFLFSRPLPVGELELKYLAPPPGNALASISEH